MAECLNFTHDGNQTHCKKNTKTIQNAYSIELFIIRIVYNTYSIELFIIHIAFDILIQHVSIYIIYYIIYMSVDILAQGERLSTKNIIYSIYYIIYYIIYILYIYRIHIYILYYILYYIYICP